MRALLRLLIIAIILSFSSVGQAATPSATPLPGTSAPPSFADLAARLLPAVVNISSTQKVVPGSTGDNDGEENPDDPDQGQNQMPALPQFPPGSPFNDLLKQFQQQHQPQKAVPMSSLGSGFIIDGDNGYVVTNSHVVKDAEDVKVTLHDDTTLNATVVGRDEKMDLAVLKVKAGKKLPAVSFGDSDKMRVGDWVLAIGNPFGLGGTVTAGIVSAQQRDINAGPYDDFIQTDASINRGNSGGPMFNVAGDVIGINTAIFSPSGGSVGIGFAIPSALAKPVISQLIQFGHTKRGWLGVKIQGMSDDLAESMGKGTPHGALIAEVTSNGPAAKIGLQTGDIITSFAGHDITQMRQLPRIVAETPIGSDAKLTYWRKGQAINATVKVGALEKAEQDGMLKEKDTEKKDTLATANGLELKAVGMTVRSITANDRDQYHIAADVTGVLVSIVDPDGEAATEGLAAGDVIIEANQTPVKSATEVRDAIAKVQADERGSVLLLLKREGETRFVALKLKAGTTQTAPSAPATPPKANGLKTPPGRISPGLAAPGQPAPMPAPAKP